MSVQQKSQAVKICDICGSDNMVFSHCDNCAKDYCYECAKTHGKTYQHGVYCGGSGDAYYCTECASALRKFGDRRLAAYQVIQDLRAEEVRWSDDFRARQKAAEKTVMEFDT